MSPRLLLPVVVYFALVALMALTLGGCASGNFKAELLGAQIEASKAQNAARLKPVLDAEIPTPNGIIKLVVHAPPAGGADLALRMPDDPWARVAGQGVEALGTVLGIYHGGRAANALVRSAGAGIADALKVSPAGTTERITETVKVVDPVIVNQPAPIIVQQPAPIIVRPEVVDVVGP